MHLFLLTAEHYLHNGVLTLNDHVISLST